MFTLSFWVTLLAVYSGNPALLTPLDLSAAFDAIGHAILLRCLKTPYALTAGIYVSCLSGCAQFVRCPKSASHTTDILPSASRISSLASPVCTLHSGPTVVCWVLTPCVHITKKIQNLQFSGVLEVDSQNIVIALLQYLSINFCSSFVEFYLLL